MKIYKLKKYQKKNNIIFDVKIKRLEDEYTISELFSIPESKNYILEVTGKMYEQSKEDENLLIEVEVKKILNLSFIKGYPFFLDVEKDIVYYLIESKMHETQVLEFKIQPKVVENLNVQEDIQEENIQIEEKTSDIRLLSINGQLYQEEKEKTISYMPFTYQMNDEVLGEINVLVYKGLLIELL